jgi:hypothetical protein
MLNLPTTEERLGKSPQRMVRYFVLVMALVYIGLGIWAWVSSYTAPTPDSIFQLGATPRRILGVVLVLYGLLRLGRVYMTHFRKPTPSSNDNE